MGDTPRFFNFGDGGARAGLPRAVTWRYGERIGERDMMALACESTTAECRSELRWQVVLANCSGPC